MKKRVDLRHLQARQYDLEGKITDVKKYLDSILSRVPEEYRDSVEIEIDTYEYYGSLCTDVNYRYYRDETPEETLERETEEFNRNEQIKKRELEQLEKLKAKYDKE